MHASFSLESQRGSSVVEFLVCAPILALLSYGAYDLNRRIENQQTVTIAARNAVMMGEAFSSSQLNQTIQRQLEVQGQIMDGKERAQVRSGLVVDIQGSKKLGEPGFELSRIDAATGLNTSGGSSGGSSFDTLSQNTGKAGAKLGSWMQTTQNLGETARVFIKDGIRSAGVETNAKGESNAIQGAIGVLARATTNNDDAGGQVLDVERRFGQKFYLRQESGYHNNEHDSFALAGLVVGASKTAWGGDGSFDDNANAVQARCMTRLHGSDACGSGGSHEFHDHVKSVALGKFIVITVLHVLEKIPWTAAFAEAAIQAVQGITGIALAAAKGAVYAVGGLGKVSAILDKGIPGFDSNVTDRLESNQIMDDFVSGMDPGTIPKGGG